ncbi:MAG: heme-binding protein [Limisphaerales bacterium]|nr:MAG: heme-binding protein [Limisphaerales bacterium]KAG0508648.1 MAG: heme-binding protein [Limisphaerales bacterium]TXT48721.1 MAG: heme-binding protein [Limisphaerales bacterium]
MHRRAAFLLLFASLTLPCLAAVSHGFRVPDGFEVTLYAGDDLAHDIFSMTTDAKGRIAVAGKEYVKILHDTDGDGKADKATLFVKASKTGAHGMYFDGPDLIMNGDGGIRRWRDTDGDGVADDEPEFWLRTERDGEHSANGIVKGPDGWFYLICGNDTGISAEHAKLPGSPIKQVNAGALVRISPDGKTSEVLAHGFRNPYDLDFHPLGHVFTYDADGERDHHLPWYSGTRMFDIATGAHHGWVLKGWGHAWNRPPAWPDNTERLWEVGRGSPTGVFVYRHRAFPARYRDGLFAICWTFGRIYFFPLTRRGSTFDTRMEIFMETAGDTGFAPVDAVVGPDGDLFVAIGGRGTIGSVFRVKYTGKLPVEKPDNSPLHQVLAAPQPLSSWSRAKWVPLAKELGKPAFEQAALNRKLTTLERIRAVEVQVELFDGVAPELARKLAGSGEPELIARVAWALARSADANAATKLLSELTHRDDPRIARAAWESLQSVGADVRRLHSNLELNQSLLTSAPTPDWFRGLNSDDRRVRAATVLAARAIGTEVFARTPMPRQLTERQRLGILRIYGPERADDPNWQSHYFNNAAFVAATSRDPVTRLDAVRLLQLGLGDVKLVQDKPDTYDGFVASQTEDIPTPLRQHVVERLAPAFPTGDADLDRELGRLLGMLSADAPGLLERVTTKLTDGSPVEDDIHFLMVAARLQGPRSFEVSLRVAHTLAGLHHKMLADKKEPSRFWPARVADMFSRLMERDAKLDAALVASPNFGLPDHALFAQRFEKPEQPAAARRLLAAPNWTSELVVFLAVLPDAELFPALRQQWSQASLQDSLLRVLARSPQPEDRARFVATLGSFQPAVVELSAKSLAKLTGEATPKELATALVSLRRHCAAPREKAARAALADLLVKWSGQTIAVTEAGDLVKAYAPWFNWFSQSHPDAAKELLGGDEDTAAFLKRLPAIAWDSGDAKRGQRLYEERMCHRCHSTSTRIGPDLTGVASRLSREDLFIAILDPSRDISPTYLPKLLTTKSGATYTGFLVYDAPTARLVQTGPDTTVRLTGDEVTSVTDTRVSLMPTGLLNGLKDAEMADFYAFLKTLKK